MHGLSLAELVVEEAVVAVVAVEVVVVVAAMLLVLPLSSSPTAPLCPSSVAVGKAGSHATITLSDILTSSPRMRRE